MQIDLKQRKYRSGMILNVSLLPATPSKKEKLGFEQLRKLLVFLPPSASSHAAGERKMYHK